MARNTRKALGVVATVGAIFSVMGPAFAGSFTSSLTDVLAGFSSRTWTHPTGDHAATTITIKPCSVGGQGAPQNAKIQLTQEQPFPLPDINRGQKTYNCPAGGTGNWGTQAAANFHFTVVTVGGQTGSLYDLSSSFVKVVW